MRGNKAEPKIKIGLPHYTKEQIEYLTKIANNKEWIAELKMMNGNIVMDDIQISDKIDKSYLSWHDGDEKNNVGFIHNHPNGIIPEFSARDFELTIKIHRLRENKSEYPYTLMGLVYEKDGKLVTVIYAMKPKKNRERDFEGLEAVESDFSSTIKEMEKSKELIKLKETNGELT